MIVTQILGGLGNQMFQYAAARALSLAHGVPMRLDVGGFDGYRLHQGFELAQVFDAPVVFAEPEELRAMLGWRSSILARRLLVRSGFGWLRGRNLVVEPHFHYWPGLRETESPCYLAGYWQSERYFADAAATIRTDFTFRQPLSGKNLELAREIGAVNAVSLHVRRGDYANNAKTLATHGLCPMEYYEAAIDHLARHIDAPHFFLFSDEPEWLRANLRMDYPVRYVDHNRGVESYNDMRLMSLCRHHIIANSSFSWWGAWLNPNPDKLVIAPRRWFANDNDVSDLFPEGWVTL